jgi:membrane-bound lytic murein transglycosylase B
MAKSTRWFTTEEILETVQQGKAYNFNGKVIRKLFNQESPPKNFEQFVIRYVKERTARGPFVKKVKTYTERDIELARAYLVGEVPWQVCAESWGIRSETGVNSKSSVITRWFHKNGQRVAA